jgi:hypothetical protein
MSKRQRERRKGYKPQQCYKCGRKYKRIARTDSVQDYNGTWGEETTCGKCWNGFVLVDITDPILCDDCGCEDCAASLDMQRQYEDYIEEQIKERLPSASVLFFPRCDWATEEAAHWHSCGYIPCPERYYEDPWQCWDDVEPCSGGA